MFKAIIVSVIAILIVVSIEAQKSCSPLKPKCSKKKVLCAVPPKDGEVCPTYECLPKKYKSPENPKKKCKTMCPIHCGDQLTCPRSKDKNGCDTGEFCMAKNPVCKDHFCPLDCPNGKQECPTGFDENGCPLGMNCVNEKDSNGCPIHCPTLCLGDDATLCPGGVDAKGCPMPDTCVEGGECQAQCPISCGPGEQLCSKGTDPKGCPLPDFCIPVKGETPPCPYFCPCPVGYLECPGMPDQNGCLGPPICLDQIDPKGCPNICPCPSGQLYCEQGEDSDGCPYPPLCIDENIGECPATCPIKCNENEQSCSIGSNPMDPKGCSYPDYCIPTKDSNGCDLHCPCKVGERKCQPSYDSCGCEFAPICVPEKGPDGCPGVCPCPSGSLTCPVPKDPDSVCEPEPQCLPQTNPDGCPNFCPCPDGKITCSTGFSPNGCPNPPSCIDAIDPNGCLVSCPIQCGDEEQLCSKGPDTKGCTYPYCIPVKDSQGCPQFCGITCDESSQFCSKGSDPNSGCPLPGFCYPLTDGNDCPQQCPCQVGFSECPATTDPSATCPVPPQCIPNPDPATNCPGFCPLESCPPEMQMCKGQLDSQGCPMPDTCLPLKDADCQVFCPPVCSPEEQVCSKGNFPATAGECPQPQFCLAKVGSDSCPLFCPCEEGNLQCPSGEYLLGNAVCQGPPLCYPLIDPISKDNCDPQCPCLSNQKQCQTTLGTNDCISQFTCVNSNDTCP